MASVSSSRFKNSRDRLERARLHRKAFESEWTSLFEGERSSVIIGHDKQSGWWTVSLDLPPDRIARIQSNQLALELGEFAYQLRAALDGLIWEAITHMQGTELSPDAKGLHGLEFPLSPTWKAKDLDKNRFHGFPFPQNLIDWMKTIQPGAADKPIGHPDRGLQNTLTDIHNLARYDRHRRLRVVGMLPLDQRIALIETVPPGGRIVELEWLGCNPLDGKYEVVRIRVVCAGGIIFPYKVSVKPNFRFSVFVEDVEPYEGKFIGDQLDRFIGAVSRVIERFDEEFSS